MYARLYTNTTAYTQHTHTYIHSVIILTEQTTVLSSYNVTLLTKLFGKHYHIYIIFPHIHTHTYTNTNQTYCLISSHLNTYKYHCNQSTIQEYVTLHIVLYVCFFWLQFVDRVMSACVCVYYTSLPMVPFVYICIFFWGIRLITGFIYIKCNLIQRHAYNRITNYNYGENLYENKLSLKNPRVHAHT